MAERPSDEEIRQWHRRFAAETNNRAWRLSEASTRSAADDEEMLNAAHAAALHWAKVGTDVHAARATLLLAQVHALLGHGILAMRYANAAFAYFTTHDSADWELAFAHAILASAASAAGDACLHSRHYALAKEIGEALPNAEECEIFNATFRHVPVASTTGPRAAPG
jgi:hypothetical protein